MVRNERPDLFAALWLAGLVLLSLGVSLAGGFVWDDAPLIVDNPEVHDPRELVHLVSSSFWETGDRHDRFRLFFRPLVSASYVLDWALWGPRPFGFHATNLLLHFACCWLVYRVARGEVREERAALLAASLFAVHPVHVESVAWISGRTDLIAAALFLWAFLAWRSGSRGLTAVLYGAALFAKEVAVTLPALVVLESWLGSGRGRTRAAVRALWPFAVALAVYAIVRLRVLGGGGQALYVLRPEAYAATALFVLARYATLLILPIGLDAHYPYPPLRDLAATLAVAGTAMLLVVGYAAWVLYRWAPRGLFWLAWIFVTLLPVLAFGRFGDVIMADRFLYLPSVGVCIGAALFVEALAASRSARWLRRAVAAVLVALTVASVARARVWRTNELLFSDMLRTSPGSALVHYNLGMDLLRRGEFEQAIEQNQRAVELNPDYALAHNNLGVALERVGRPGEALEYYERALRLAPDMVEARLNTGHLLVLRGRHGEGLALLRELARLHPRNPRTLFALGHALYLAGRHAEALAYLERTRAVDPKLAETYYLTGKIRYEQGSLAEAATWMERFLALWSGDEAHAAAAQKVIAEAREGRAAVR
ncbi:MAG TPA: tetratricopeptide repeat protein [Candidatus Polarisedimenticolaceae bacterium]|nr:tetratricopeptide repeat protein [Candidatus Polarisedimenticolaceae bacterium]